MALAAIPNAAATRVNQASSATIGETRKIGNDPRDRGKELKLAGLALGGLVGAGLLWKLPLPTVVRTIGMAGLGTAAAGCALSSVVGATSDHRKVGTVIAEQVSESEVLALARAAGVHEVNIQHEGADGRYTLYTSTDGAVTKAFVRDGIAIHSSGNIGGWPLGSPSQYDFGAYGDDSFLRMLKYNAFPMNDKELAVRGDVVDYRSAS